MNTIDQLHLKNDWTDIKKRITNIAMQLESDSQYSKEKAVRDLVITIEIMDKTEPRIEYVKTPLK
ncbi:hypothetical protein ACQKP0_15880 [Heyndrickxia sp. NPDC080065]|uniref:hypothetical protein n=1 Tax=Heyndrickxia sp. NPDC080065 TaxID=3390568 RepID=UPI003CFD0F8C